METKKHGNKKACPQELTFLSLPVCLVMTLCGRSWIPALRMRKGAENGRCLAWLRTARTLPVADLSPVLLAGFLSHAPACRQARPWGPAPHSSFCPPGQVRTWAGVWRLRREWLAWLWPTSPGPPRPRGDRGGPAGDGEALGGPRWRPRQQPRSPSPARPGFALPSFSRVCVSFLLHAMAVVPRADETILGAAPGSPFPGNFLGTQMTPSTHLPGTRAARVPARSPRPPLPPSFRSALPLLMPRPAGGGGLGLNLILLVRKIRLRELARLA